MTKLWEKDSNLNKEIEEFTVGNDFLLDRKLVKYDCRASIAHVKMLKKVDLLNEEEASSIEKELNNIIKLAKKGEFDISKEDEDCHTAIENHLVKKLGNVGKKVHAARSRNDQILAALRLYYKGELSSCKKLINKLLVNMKKFVENYGKIEFAGYTHTRKAMPTNIKMWMQAFIESMEDNKKLLFYVTKIIDKSPLGTGAGYGLPVDVDRKYTKDLLGFGEIQKNPIYVQNSRGKFESDILHVLSQIMLDLNKIASDLILFTMPKFGYFKLPKEVCTGSSIMPQKKNPDVLELLRGKYHIITSFEYQVKNITSDLISGYNRDIQLTKGPTIKGLEITKKSLFISSTLFKELEVQKENCEESLTEEIYSTKEVYDLVKEGISFREAYRRISEKY